MLLERVISLVSAQFHLPEQEIQEETSFDLLGADELDMAELLLAAESEFELEFSDEIAAPETVSQLVDLVEQALRALREEEGECLL